MGGVLGVLTVYVQTTFDDTFKYYRPIKYSKLTALFQFQGDCNNTHVYSIVAEVSPAIIIIHT